MQKENWNEMLVVVKFYQIMLNRQGFPVVYYEAKNTQELKYMGIHYSLTSWNLSRTAATSSGYGDCRFSRDSSSSPILAASHTWVAIPAFSTSRPFRRWPGQNKVTMQFVVKVFGWQTFLKFRFFWRQSHSSYCKMLCNLWDTVSWCAWEPDAVFLNCTEIIKFSETVMRQLRGWCTTYFVSWWV